MTVKVEVLEMRGRLQFQCPVCLELNAALREKNKLSGDKVCHFCGSRLRWTIEEK